MEQCFVGHKVCKIGILITIEMRAALKKKYPYLNCSAIFRMLAIEDLKKKGGELNV